MSPLPLSLIAMAYNEEANVPVVVPEMLSWLRGRGAPYELLLVDDGSTDGTREHALAAMGGDPACRVLSHDRNRGMGAAIKTGFRAGTLPWITFLPCDGQIAPAELDVLCRAAERDPVRVVFSIYRARDDGASRRVLSLGVRTLIRTVHGVTMRSDGPYLFARELFLPELLTSDTFFLNFEFPIRMLRAKEPHSVVTIDCLPRLHGSSKSTQLKRIVGVTRDLVDLRLRLWRGR